MSDGTRNRLLIELPALRGTVTLGAIVVCVSLHLALVMLDFLRLIPFQTSLGLLGISRQGLRSGLVFQLVTAPLAHADGWHLLANMLSLAFLGPAVERRLGRRHYVQFSAVCALAGMVGFLALGDPRAVCVGYSGAIFGILVAQALFFPKAIVYFYGVFPLRMRAVVLIVGAAVLLATLQPQQDRIAHAAHLFGALAGLVYLLAWRRMRGRGTLPGKRTKRTKRAKRVVKIPDEL